MPHRIHERRSSALRGHPSDWLREPLAGIALARIDRAGLGLARPGNGLLRSR